MAIIPECNPAAEVQGPGPSGSGNPFDVNVLSFPEECLRVEGCLDGDPVQVDVLSGPGFNESAFNIIPQGLYSATQAVPFTNPKNNGLIIFVEITTPGTGSITPVLQFMNSQSGFAYQISLGLVPLRATVIPTPNRVAYIFYPGAGLNVFATQNGFKYVNPIACPRDLRFQMTHSNASVWDYRVDGVFFG